jgi:hypothetical protein
MDFAKKEHCSPRIAIKLWQIDRVHFSSGFTQNKTLSMPTSCRFFIQKTDEIWMTLRLMHGGIRFDKILPKQDLYKCVILDKN